MKFQMLQLSQCLPQFTWVCFWFLQSLLLSLFEKIRTVLHQSKRRLNMSRCFVSQRTALSTLSVFIIGKPYFTLHGPDSCVTFLPLQDDVFVSPYSDLGDHFWVPRVYDAYVRNYRHDQQYEILYSKRFIEMS